MVKRKERVLFAAEKLVIEDIVLFSVEQIMM